MLRYPPFATGKPDYYKIEPSNIHLSVATKIEKTLSNHEKALDDISDIQKRRDEVRRMVADGRPAEGIPRYRGRRAGDGSPISFLRRHYARYLSESIVPTMFMHDLRVIDTTLASAVENESRGRSLPLGTKSDLLTLLAEGHFTDGLNTRKRVRETMRHRNKM